MAGRLTAIGRGVKRACPRCGSRPLFRSFFELHERCPGCGLGFEREEGYWLGAMVVALGVTEGVFAGAFLVAVLATWPEPPWTLLLVLGLVLNGVLPIVLYPWAKTAWMGLHYAFDPASPTEEAEAIAAQASHEEQR